MKIALLITGLGMGGAERQVCDLADNFSMLGHQVLLISIVGKSVTRPQLPAVDVVELGMAKSIWGGICAYRKIKDLMLHFKPDVVHSHMVHANLFARIIRLTMHIPKLICTAHSSNEGGSIRMLAYRMTDSLCDISTNVSKEAVDIFVQKKAVPATRMIAMYNGVDTERFNFSVSSRTVLRGSLGLGDDISVLLAVGRLTMAKDYPNLLAAFSKIESVYEKAHLFIIGAGEEEENLKATVMNLGLTKRVHFLGLRHDISDWMSAADVFILSSAWEGFGLVVAEAMACQRVVVATDCGGVKEVVGDVGFLVPPKNSQKLASAISTALSLPLDTREELGISARCRIFDNYSLKAVCSKWIEMYHK